jgi:hypothetical protein
LSFVYLGGSVIIFSPTLIDFHRASFQEEIKEPSMSGLVLHFSFDDFKSIDWIEINHEFSLNDRLYDVRKITKTSTRFEIDCVNDEEEESLIALFNSWKKNYPVGKTKLKLQPPFVEIFFFENKLTDFSPNDSAVNKQFYFLDSVDLIAHPPEVS